jgi:KaiC/GvpD/RAD55 family RecA-like ATPase
MIKRELNERSPLRILERSTRGGLGKGNLGVIAARQGVGKTACLVHIATDQLLQGKQVIHVSFATNPRHIVDWYEDIFREIAEKFGLESAMAVHDEMIRRRIIMNFNQASIRLPQVIGSLRSMIRDGHFAADAIVVDAYDFSALTRAELEQVREFAAEQGLEIWFSVSLGYDQPSYDAQGIPTLLEDLIDAFSILICLKPEENHIRLQLVKDHGAAIPDDLHLKLDPKTLLIARE